MLSSSFASGREVGVGAWIFSRLRVWLSHEVRKDDFFERLIVGCHPITKSPHLWGVQTAAQTGRRKDRSTPWLGRSTCKREDRAWFALRTRNFSFDLQEEELIFSKKNFPQPKRKCVVGQSTFRFPKCNLNLKYFCCDKMSRSQEWHKTPKKRKITASNNILKF